MVGTLFRAAVLGAALAVTALTLPVVAQDQAGADQPATRPIAEVPEPAALPVATPLPHPTGAVHLQRPSSPEPNLLLRVPRNLPITAKPGAGTVVGTLPAHSKYYEVPTVAWVQQLSDNGRFGRVTVPYSGARRSGWIRLGDLRRSQTFVTVRVDLSRHVVSVEKRDQVLFRIPAATGAPVSPTPPGRYFVTDRIPFPSGGSLGTFAFGISGIQPNLPPGWSGGNQLAIHGTNAPSTIGRSASAGCLRVSEHALDALRPLLRLGTPVIIDP